MKKRLFLLCFFILSICLQAFSQPARQLVQVIVTPDKADHYTAIRLRTVLG